MALKGLLLLILFLNYATVPLVGGKGSSCTCRLDDVDFCPCSVTVFGVHPSPPGMMRCHCRPAAENHTQYRQGCQCGMDRESVSKPPFLPSATVAVTGIKAEGFVSQTHPGRVLPGWTIPPFKPPPGSFPHRVFA